MQVNLTVSDDARTFMKECLNMTGIPDKTCCLGRGPLNGTGPIGWSFVLMPKSEMDELKEICSSSNTDCRAQFSGFDLPVTSPEHMQELEGKILAYKHGYLSVWELN